MAPGKLLDGQVALVTGAGSGFGAGIAKLFAREGAKVLCADINEENGTRTVKEITGSGDLAHFVKMNVTVPGDWEQALVTAKEKFGGLDILVNNAGWTYRIKDTLTVTEAEYDRIFDINVKSIFHSVGKIIPHFLAQGYGNIINIGSCITEKPTVGLTWYGATKGAVDMITRHLSNEYSPQGIRVNGVSPSISETPLMREFIGRDPDSASKESLTSHVPLGRLCTPLDIAKATLYFATPYFNDFQTGIILRVDGGHYT
ncbi:uncharacterized protein Z520_02668 [Fonsecaea multimorphosa CBS 102226]|uniref:Uncharacterized protein n=1 Tax=Fonsecaea multimorphosa CBS 102226 TaxID=1442371 RepID=A0A0D2HGS2_9EURO|nr:uncharacterized protein Z520_02668 [Fonsecaea multimorphosa CBS 102226]KIY01116.1 hypothetical protein Z520_02668 [Fonsecaea multimorphosa CBS 102226]